MVPRFALPAEARPNRWCTTQRAGLDGRTGELHCGGTSINRLASCLSNQVDRRVVHDRLAAGNPGSPTTWLNSRSGSVMITHSDDRTSGVAGGRDLRLDRMRKPDVRRRCVSITASNKKIPQPPGGDCGKERGHGHVKQVSRCVALRTSVCGLCPLSDRYKNSAH